MVTLSGDTWRSGPGGEGIGMGWIAAGAGLTFGLALVMLATFFRTQNERFDRVAEWSFVLFGILATPTILAVSGKLGSLGPEPVGIALTIIGVAGVLITGLGELGLVLKLVAFRRISALLTVAFLGFLVWIGGVSVATVTASSPALPVNLGWLGIVSIVLGVAIIAWIVRVPGVITGDREPGQAAMAAFFVPMAGIVGWMIWLGLSL